MKCFRDFVGVFKCKEEKDFSNITELATVVEKFYEYGCEIRPGFLFKDIEKYFEKSMETIKPFDKPPSLKRASNVRIKRKLKILGCASRTLLWRKICWEYQRKFLLINKFLTRKIQFVNCLIGESGVIWTGFCFSCVGRFLITRFVK